jgi:protein phosphatase PTC7
MQLRPNAVYYVSPAQTHAFNTPYQLSKIPARLLDRLRAFGSMPFMDSPGDANVTTHEVRHGDVLVFATDGVWDNLAPADILRHVSHYMTGFGAWESGEEGMDGSKKLRELTEPGGIAKDVENTVQALLAVAITGEAKAASENQKIDGPFAKEVHRLFPGENYRGGKADDICVIVVIVVQDG